MVETAEQKEISKQGSFEEVPISKWRRFLQIFAGFIFIIAILYFSSVYQYFAFSKTSEFAEPNNHKQLVSGDVIKIPVSFYVIGGSSRDENNVLDLSKKTSKILAQAGLAVEVDGIYEVDVAQANVLNALDDEDFLNNLPSYNSKSIIVILSRSLFGLNGVALGRGGVIAIAEYTTGFDFRTLAHEIGHILGLGHVSNDLRLMSSGGRGEEITFEEASRARKNAKSFLEL